jgi:integrase
MAGVKLRIQKRDNNKGHYYLEYYLGSKMVNGKQKPDRKREGLGLDIYLKPKNNLERDYNKKNKNFAEAILLEREYGFMTSTHKLPNKNKGNKNFTDYFLDFAKKKNQSNKGLKSYTLTLNYLIKYRGKGLNINNIDYAYCRDFLSYLLSSTKSNGEKLSTASVIQYFNKLRLIISELNKEGLIDVDYCKDIKNPKLDTKPRIWLTQKEIKMLVDTPYHLRNIKELYLFMCFTSLRHIDVINLKWNDVKNEGENHFINIKQQKTGDFLTIPLTEAALNLMGDRKGNDDKIFEGAKYSANNNNHLKSWTLKAGINKHLTFHTGRHTFATNHYSQFKDAKATGMWLGHQSSKSTDVYVHLVNQTLFDQAKELKQIID